MSRMNCGGTDVESGKGGEGGSKTLHEPWQAVSV